MSAAPTATAEKAADAKAAPAKGATIFRLREAQLARAEFKRDVHDVAVPHGTPYEELLKPEYWAHVARNLKPGDRLEISPEDGSYIAELYVRDAGHNWAKVVELFKKDFDGPQTTAGDAEIPGFKIEYRGKTGKHTVIREKDGQVLRDGMQTRSEAQAWLTDYAKALRN